MYTGLCLSKPALINSLSESESYMFFQSWKAHISAWKLANYSYANNFLVIKCQTQPIANTIHSFPGTAVRSQIGPHIQSARWDWGIRWTTPDRRVEGLISKGHSLWGLSWVGAVQADSCTCLPDLKVYRGLKTFSHMYCPDALSTTFFSPGCSLECGSRCGNRGQNLCSKYRRVC